MNKFFCIMCKAISHPSIVFGIFINKNARLFSDKLYLELMFRITMHKKLDLKHPKTFNEKLQWLKLNNKNPQYTMMVDKVDVKKYVSEKLGEQYIIPTLGVWDNPDDIDFNSLPKQFVIKCNHNSGLGMCICKDKDKLNIDRVKNELRKGLAQDYFLHGREWPYKNVKRKIIAEQFMIDESGGDLKDYKFFCFNGEPLYCQVISDRNTDEKIDFYDMNWNRVEGLIGLIGLNIKAHNSLYKFPCPHNFEQMKINAKILSKNIPFSRIDQYEINGICYFGEITFYPASGFGEFRPDEWNYKLGELITVV